MHSPTGTVASQPWLLPSGLELPSVPGPPTTLSENCARRRGGHLASHKSRAVVADIAGRFTGGLRQCWLSHRLEQVIWEKPRAAGTPAGNKTASMLAPSSPLTVHAVCN